MRNYKAHWLLVSASLIAISACAPKSMSDYRICNDVNVTNNDCPDVTSNVVVVNDINGMSN